MFAGYSPFFTSGLLSQPDYTSFLTLDSISLRSIPSPKPAPSATLPDLPNSSPPRLPSLTPIPALDIPLPSLTISRTQAPLTAIRRISVATKATSSSVSTHVRRSNRSEALARLEGRYRHHPITLHTKPPQLHQQRNFMNMTDDEDDEEQEDHDLDSLNLPVTTFSNPVLEPEDVVLPTSTPSINDSFLLISPPHPVNPQSTKDWIPLKSFIDLHNDDDSSSWTWTSFIHVANVS